MPNACRRFRDKKKGTLLRLRPLSKKVRQEKGRLKMFLKVLRIISGPIVGAVIGYITNYIAVKMLFRPYKEKRIGKIKIPFTPGIIPKRQAELAKAVGKAVGENLFTENDLVSAFENISFDFNLPNSLTVGEMLADTGTGEQLKDKSVKAIAQSIYGEVVKTDVGKIIAEQGKIAFAEKKSKLGMFAFMISDDLVEGLAGELSQKVNDYLSENAYGIIEEKVKDKIELLSDKKTSELCENELIGELFNAVAKRVFVEAVKNNVKQINVSAVVETKVNAMDVKELEKLCMSVMKKELSAVVNLGALIGFLLGIVNIFI